MFKPFITGILGTSLSQQEIHFLKDHKPWGIILFARNIESPEQVLALTQSLREVTGRTELPILIDQEGGRVARLKGSLWRSYPPAAFFHNAYMMDHALGLESVRLNAELQACELRRVGININCAPMVDVRFESAHDIIGDRAFSTDPEEVALYGRAVIKGLTSQGVLPVIKHIPGHGRSLCDSHESLPVVDAKINELTKDFHPFIALKDAPLAMTAHILYESLDSNQCATLSESIIRHVIRGMIGFTGLLMSDDLSMKALNGNFSDLAIRTIKSGCDLVLHCNGKIEEMAQIANALDFDTHFLALRTEKIFSDLHFQKSPRAEEDVIAEYQDVMTKVTSLIKSNHNKQSRA